jgi:RNA polymerase sigma factor (sigma-70 family)
VIFLCAQRGVALARAEDLAEEAVHVARIKAWQTFTQPGRFQNDTHFANWFRRVVVNHVRDVLRRERRQRQFGEGEEEQIETPPAQLATWIETEDLQAVVSRLPADDQLLLKLCHEDGLTLDELAERLLQPDDSTPNARRLKIWRRLHAIQERLRQWLLENGFVLEDTAILPDDV